MKLLMIKYNIVRKLKIHLKIKTITYFIKTLLMQKALIKTKSNFN